MRRLIVFALFSLSACPSVDANAGKYSCSKPEDCGSGYECIAQFAGGSLCFKEGVCTDSETCDGTDENCDGRIDESFPESADVCQTTLLGVCKTGVRTCEGGGLGCKSTRSPSTELCNSLDDDCDGQVDESFDLATDPSNCGSCGHACSVGTGCFASTCRETNCGDAIDNDGDGLTDCVDPACLEATCDVGSIPQRRCGSLDAGVDADAGAGFPLGCFLPETDCANGLDDDGDGQIDCLDPDCDGRTCTGGMTCSNLACP